MRFTDVDAFHRHIAQHSEKWKQLIEIEHDNLVDEMIELMRDEVSGNVSTAELRRLGHPFGRRSGGRKRGRVPNLPINKQSGNLKRSLKRKKVVLPRKISYEVGFTESYAKYVLNPPGTKKMVGRGYWREIEKQYRKKRSELIRRVRQSGVR